VTYMSTLVQRAHENTAMTAVTLAVALFIALFVSPWVPVAAVIFVGLFFAFLTFFRSIGW